MSDANGMQRGKTLLAQVRWLVFLRWWAGLAIMVAVFLDSHLLDWYDLPRAMVGLGLFILGYNAALWALIRRQPVPLRRVQVLAYGQIALDLVCLTVLVANTGALLSPLIGLYVLHMVFASLLLPRAAAYGGAVLAVLMLATALAISGQTPAGHEDVLRSLGWALTLVLTVFLANRVTQSLRQHRRRLIRRNRRIRRLVRKLRRQQLTMIQHEKQVTIGQMAAGVAHEVNNPLASMDSVLQLMKRHERWMTRHNVELLAEQVQRIKLTVRQLTDFAHPTDYTWRTMPLNDLVDSALQLVQFDHRLRRIRLQVEHGPEHCTLRVQPHAIQQALTNLIMNAIDVLGEVENAVLTISCGPADERHCYIAVTDNGPGIASTNMGRIFEPFFTTKPVGKGTGLGLTITQTLVHNQGGLIELDSREGGPTTFRIMLPCPVAPADQSPAVSVLPRGTSDGSDSQG